MTILTDICWYFTFDGKKFTKTGQLSLEAVYETIIATSVSRIWSFTKWWQLMFTLTKLPHLLKKKIDQKGVSLLSACNGCLLFWEQRISGKWGRFVEHLCLTKRAWQCVTVTMVITNLVTPKSVARSKLLFDNQVSM